jgi:H+-translocating NAD(P) transhydrogenase subunit beta
MEFIINTSYFAAAVLFILGLKKMSSPVTARSGIMWAGVGMLVATVATFFTPNMHNYFLMILAIGIGSAAAYISAKKVAMTDMPQMIALYNGMGGGAAAAIAAVELLKISPKHAMGSTALTLAVIGAIIGAVSLSGSMVAFAKLQELMKKSFVFEGQQKINFGILIATLLLGLVIILQGSGISITWFAILFAVVLAVIIASAVLPESIKPLAGLQNFVKSTGLFDQKPQITFGVLGALLLLTVVIVFQGNEISGATLFFFFALALAFGVLMTLPIGGADMPVVISLYNALTGLAVAFEGFVLGNAAMIIAGTVVGSAGTLLTQLMAKAMNRSLSNVLFSGFGSAPVESSTEVTGSMKPIEAPDVAVMMAYAAKVIIVPGYGMAVAQAQHKVWELTKQLMDHGVTVKFAIHPVAGRMPGHMNVLLAEAGVPYDLIFDLEEINAEFPQADVALIIGANDVVNPVARIDKSSPIYGMPILDADKAKNVIVIKRGKGAGFSGVENHLFYADNTRMLYGDGQKMVAELISGVKSLDS